MKVKIIEVENGYNWGKFAIARPDEEWTLRSETNDSNTPLLTQLGWGRDHIWVFDLQTGEAACFRHGGFARADLDKHQVWVCPMFEPFLTWLYKQDVTDLDKLPTHVRLTEAEAPSSMFGYRRAGALGPVRDALVAWEAGEVGNRGTEAEALAGAVADWIGSTR